MVPSSRPSFFRFVRFLAIAGWFGGLAMALLNDQFVSTSTPVVALLSVLLIAFGTPVFVYSQYAQSVRCGRGRAGAMAAPFVFLGASAGVVGQQFALFPTSLPATAGFVLDVAAVVLVILGFVALAYADHQARERGR